MRCEDCKKELNENYNFCPNCGKSVYTREYVDPKVVEEVVEDKSETVSLKNWLLTFGCFFIPWVGPFVYLILLFIWGLSKNTPKSKKNFALAQLIVMTCLILFIIFYMSLYWNDIMSMMESMYQMPLN